MPTQKSSRKLVAYKWVVAVMAVTAVVVGVIIYQVVTSSDSTEEQPIVTVSQDLEEPPDAAVQLEEQEGQIQEAADTPVSTTSTTLPEVQEPVVEEEPVEEVTEDPATGTEVDDSTDWVLHIPPNPVWLEEYRAAVAYYDNIRHGGNGDQETMKQMWSELVGDNCDANVDGLCSGVAIGRMYAMRSRRACPRGWSLDTALWYDEQYDSQMCSHPDHPAFYHPSQAYYPPEEADPQGVPSDYWTSNAG